MVDHEIPGRIILGSGRSGTTWVQDSLAFANQLRPIFEPLHEGESEFGKQFAYGVMSPGDVDLSLQRHFMDLSQGKIHSRWIDYRAPRSLLFPTPSRLLTIKGLRSWQFVWRKYLRDRPALRVSADRPITLIKCIRANLMAGWLAQDLGFRTILIVRHPCATIESQYGSGTSWDPTLALIRYRLNNRFHERTDGRYLEILHSKLTKLQAHTLNWIIENQLPVERARNHGYECFHYEHLLSNPCDSWQAICTALSLPNVPSTSILNQPSQQTYGNGGAARFDARKPRWRAALSEDQLVEIQRMLDLVECEMYNVSSEEPVLLAKMLGHRSMGSSGT